MLAAFGVDHLEGALEGAGISLFRVDDANEEFGALLLDREPRYYFFSGPNLVHLSTENSWSFRGEYLPELATGLGVEITSPEFREKCADDTWKATGLIGYLLDQGDFRGATLAAIAAFEGSSGLAIQGQGFNPWHVLAIRRLQRELSGKVRIPQSDAIIGVPGGQVSSRVFLFLALALDDARMVARGIEVLQSEGESLHSMAIKKEVLVCLARGMGWADASSLLVDYALIPSGQLERESQQIEMGRSRSDVHWETHRIVACGAFVALMEGDVEKAKEQVQMVPRGERRDSVGMMLVGLLATAEIPSGPRRSCREEVFVPSLFGTRVLKDATSLLGL